MNTTLFTGFNFEGIGAGKPQLRVLGAYNITHEYSKAPPRKFSHPFWVLSCRFTNHEYIRLHTVRNPWQQVMAGRIMLTPPGSLYWQDFSRVPAPTRGAFIAFTGGETLGLQEFTGNKKTLAVFLDPENRVSRAISDVARYAASLKAKAFCKVQSTLYGLMDQLLSAQPVDKKNHVWTLEGGGHPDRAERSFRLQVNEYLLARLAEKTVNRDIARRFSLSVPGLFKKLAAETDESPMKMLARLRIDRAKALLMQGEPLKVIAGRTGFWDAYHLSKVFKHYAGLSPRKYLKALVNAG
ncbi:MAG: hypothetical protein A2268_15815 [Candidatus Raymondbacteria bacterium RifOxyA12_full_50_37]|uniref:HTH araC/xylS-type domain-containing protein n=1 Tax=Candidatus Raymondbacteria bacterium RIFOXYD12_FULL_49_13 TaxID=1817890 RepID=A0A1F7FAD9_UNCRA|nr:MAG: hypothetical protein A2268_15815 [Candidatus Raymondbacteria bacterium RifOxyA12_full_50_37]OGJ89217.1 MAG: hypothetical protein A2248_18710 [Candidatus Raymondbacteria bacterium RIFOXYA2_FULL_49_16]OGJ97383.1 MAG: hypothetical protein A2453_03630 [Candidatus Raymondbacteria bacterium RIFOXYC2_FULL_50_21]OGK03568.1 MAG: hypothetical protein A2519_01855 [Candidatus Raymondbacteria bacterium RIFOXYD12_FULL_49_13]